MMCTSQKAVMPKMGAMMIATHEMISATRSSISPLKIEGIAGARSTGTADNAAQAPPRGWQQFTKGPSSAKDIPNIRRATVAPEPTGCTLACYWAAALAAESDPDVSAIHADN